MPSLRAVLVVSALRMWSLMFGREDDAACGLVLNALHEPCRLLVLHEGFHESLAGRNRYGQQLVVEWWTPGAPARERRYFFGDVVEAGDEVGKS